jgi:spore maturation protein CgeB
MNILIIQENGRHKSSRHMRECFSLKHSFEKLGHSATCWGLGHDSYKSGAKPYLKSDIDVILCLENYNNGWLPEDIGQSKAIKIFWTIDSHCALNEHMQLCDKFKPQILLSSSPGYLKHYSNISERQYWFPNAVDIRWFRKKDVKKSKELIFAASPIADRVRISQFLNRIVGLELVSDKIGEDYVNLLNSTKVSFNKSISDDINYRIFETLACHTPLITNIVPGLEQLLVPDQDYASYNADNPKEMIGVCQWLLKDKRARIQIADGGYKKVISMHTYDNRATYLCDIIEGL